MSEEIKYKYKISQYQWDDLLNLWEAIKNGNTPEWSPGKAFEYLIVRAFQLEGADVIYPFSVKMAREELEQIDGVVYTSGLACLIESKDQKTSVNIEPIAKLRNQLLRRPATAIGIIFSRSGFTEQAMTLARFLAPQTILLWEGEEIEYALEHRYLCKGLIAKYRYCIEQSVPYYNIAYN
ncbi:MAG: restriction endonuclease [Pseudomonadota bacterium]